MSIIEFRRQINAKLEQAQANYENVWSTQLEQYKESADYEVRKYTALVNKLDQNDIDIYYFENADIDDPEFQNWYQSENSECSTYAEELDCDHECTEEGYCPFALNIKLMELYESLSNTTRETFHEYFEAEKGEPND